jgi:hypothetical protein
MSSQPVPLLAPRDSARAPLGFLQSLLLAGAAIIACTALLGAVWH